MDLFPVNATLICFIVVKQSCMINPVVRKINISHFKDSASQKICIESKEGQGYSTVSFHAKESIWKTNGIAFKSRVYFARQKPAHDNDIIFWQTYPKMGPREQ